MEEGSMRVDANVSLRAVGTEAFGTRCEIKNLNSMRSLGHAIEYEARRQAVLLASGEVVRQETRHWDEADGRTHTLRTKEDADDYRYFPEPDLVPVAPDDAWRERVRAALPAMPAERRSRLAAKAGASESVSYLVVRGLDDLALDTIAAGGDPARVLVHLEHNVVGDQRPAPASLAALTRLEVEGALTATQAKQVLADLLDAGGDGDPAAIAAARGFQAMDTSDLDTAVDEAIAAQPAAWEKYVGGDDKVVSALVGAVMRATKGRADGKAVTAALVQRRTQP
jgi:aspartyl-tRNA(Asn)/glutamyl-tRNA(Gln) amidotransferase subunit B